MPDPWLLVPAHVLAEAPLSASVWA